MAPPLATKEPALLTAGDTASWSKSLDDYPAGDGWALSYAFRYQNGSGVLDVAGVASGADFLLTIPAASSSLMKPGLWNWAAYATLSGTRYQVETGILNITPNLAVLDSAADLRSPAKRAYDNALAAWEGVTLGQTVTLNGRTYTQHNLSDLMKYVDRCKTDYHAEVQALEFAKSGMNPRHIQVRLTRV